MNVKSFCFGLQTGDLCSRGLRQGLGQRGQGLRPPSCVAATAARHCALVTGQKLAREGSRSQVAWNHPFPGWKENWWKYEHWVHVCKGWGSQPMLYLLPAVHLRCFQETYCGLLHSSQRRRGLVDGVGVLPSWIWIATFRRKWSWRHAHACAGYQCCTAAARDHHHPLLKTLVPGEMTSEIPRSEKQNLLCFGVVSCLHDKYYPNKTAESEVLWGLRTENWMSITFSNCCWHNSIRCGADHIYI